MFLWNKIILRLQRDVTDRLWDHVIMPWTVIWILVGKRVGVCSLTLTSDLTWPKNQVNLSWTIWLRSKLTRGGVWPGKNLKYFKKRKLKIEFQSFFLFNILLQNIQFDIKMLYNFANNNMIEISRQKKNFLLNNYMYSSSKCTGAYFCLLI